MSRGDRPVTVVVRRELRWVALGAARCWASLVLVLGTVVTGSGPHSGDADEVARFGLDVAHHELAARRRRPAVLGARRRLRAGRPPERRPGCATTRRSDCCSRACVVQGLIGYIQYFTGVPVVLVSLHMLGACLVWIAALEVFLSTRRRARGSGPLVVPA